LDAIEFAELLNRCAPGAPAGALTQIVRQASSFEPLLITIEGKKAIPIQVMSLDEGVQLASEATVSGQNIRIGLAQLNAEERKAAGLSISASFDPCRHVAAMHALYLTHRLTPQAQKLERPSVEARESVRLAVDEHRPATHTSFRMTAPTKFIVENSFADPSLGEERQSLDVYRSTRGASLFVYQR
jgi:type IV secretion system protein VirB1